jgi:hypothetical protein
MFGETSAAGVDTGCAVPPSAAGRANIGIAPKTKTAAASVRIFMKSNLCEDARWNGYRPKSDHATTDVGLAR